MTRHVAGAIAVDPANANRVFLACGKYNWSNPSGVYFCGDICGIRARSQGPSYLHRRNRRRRCGCS